MLSNTSVTACMVPAAPDYALQRCSNIHAHFQIASAALKTSDDFEGICLTDGQPLINHLIMSRGAAHLRRHAAAMLPMASAADSPCQFVMFIRSHLAIYQPRASGVAMLSPRVTPSRTYDGKARVELQRRKRGPAAGSLAQKEGLGDGVDRFRRPQYLRHPDHAARSRGPRRFRCSVCHWLWPAVCEACR